MHMFYCVMKGI